MCLWDGNENEWLVLFLYSNLECPGYYRIENNARLVVRASRVYIKRASVTAHSFVDVLRRATKLAT